LAGPHDLDGGGPEPFGPDAICLRANLEPESRYLAATQWLVDAVNPESRRDCGRVAYPSQVEAEHQRQPLTMKQQVELSEDLLLVLGQTAALQQGVAVF
jgi:hypothetical protein